MTHSIRSISISKIHVSQAHSARMSSEVDARGLYRAARAARLSFTIADQVAATIYSGLVNGNRQRNQLCIDVFVHCRPESAAQRLVDLYGK